MSDSNKSDVENVCKEFWRAFQGVLSWKWDSRHETVLAEFSVDRKDGVRTILERYLGITWDSSNIGKATDAVRMINGNFGGLMPGQLLFTSPQDAAIYCAWWPWGDKKTISIRVAPFYNKSSATEKAELIKSFKGWFGI